MQSINRTPLLLLTAHTDAKLFHNTDARVFAEKVHVCRHGCIKPCNTCAVAPRVVAVVVVLFGVVRGFVAWPF